LVLLKIFYVIHHISALNPCGSGSQIIYAWAQNAPKLKLPKDVAFRVGGPDSGIDWLVLQVIDEPFLTFGLVGFSFMDYIL